MRYLTHDRSRIAHNCRLDDLLRVVRGVRARAAAVPPVDGPVGGPVVPYLAAEVPDVRLGVTSQSYYQICLAFARTVHADDYRRSLPPKGIHAADSTDD